MGSLWPLELVVCLNLHIKCIIPEVTEVVHRICLIIDKPKAQEDIEHAILTII